MTNDESQGEVVHGFLWKWQIQLFLTVFAEIIKYQINLKTSEKSSKFM